MNTCYLLLPPIGLPFACGDSLWWSYLVAYCVVVAVIFALKIALS